MFEKPNDAEKVREFEKINASNKKYSLVSVPSRYNILHFKKYTKAIQEIANKSL